MNIKPWYETLSENYAKTYDKESFTQGTVGECDFIEQKLNHDKSLGYKKIEIFGAKLGAFSRNDKLTTADFEMLVVAEK